MFVKSGENTRMIQAVLTACRHRNARIIWSRFAEQSDRKAEGLEVFSVVRNM